MGYKLILLNRRKVSWTIQPTTPEIRGGFEGLESTKFFMSLLQELGRYNAKQRDALTRKADVSFSWSKEGHEKKKQQVMVVAERPAPEQK